MGEKGRERVYKLCLCAMMVAVAVILSFWRIDFFIGGSSAKHISFSGGFLALGAIVGGPLYGAVAFGAADVLSYLVKPSGAYLPLITLVAVLKGAATGALWLAVKNARLKRVGFVCVAVCGAALAAGLFNALMTSGFGGTRYAGFLSGFGADADLLSFGLMLAGVIGLANCALFHIASGKMGGAADKYFRCLLTMLLPGLMATALNTPLLRLFIPFFGNQALATLLIPRLAIEMVLVAINAYLLTALLTAYGKVRVRS